MENQNQDATKRTWQTDRIWAFQALATLHFIRCIVIIYELATSLTVISGETYFLIIIVYITSMFVEMLIGFMFLTRRFRVIYLALLYFATGILAAHPIDRSLRYLVFILPNIANYGFVPPWLSIELMIGALNLIEIILLLFLIIHQERRIRNSSY